MKIDSHQHFWKYNKSEYSWISDQMGVLKKDFLPDDLIKELNGIGFDGSVAVQARQSLEETSWLLEIADQNDFIKGVVGWVDLCSDKAEEQISEFVRNRKLVGVRHVIQDEPDDHFMLQKSFLRSINLLKKYNLVYDILILPKHLTYAEKLVRQFQEQQFVLDHIAKPLIKENKISPWKEGIKRLSTYQNVSCKLSGMVTEASWHGWKREDFEPYLDVVFEAFGTSRLMIGSDWPVCTVSSGYSPTMKIVFDYIKTFNLEEKEMVLGGNAIRIYNLQIRDKK
ncbi:MAG TPA: amidohydrolase family protein [Bacteroidales bacterium]|nr:amidohydrolase family protein [Bacteroidales bacterium]